MLMKCFIMITSGFGNYFLLIIIVYNIYCVQEDFLLFAIIKYQTQMSAGCIYTKTKDTHVSVAHYLCKCCIACFECLCTSIFISLKKF